MSIGTRISALVFFLSWTTGVAWAQGTITDQRVRVTYPVEQWSPDFRSAELVGTEPNAADGIVRRLGWWYRLQDDASEHALPYPDGQTYHPNGEMTLQWNNLRGSGLTVIERNVVIDGEGPSGGMYASLTIWNRSDVAQTVDAFHFVQGPAIQGGFHVEARSNTYLKFTNTTDPSAVLRYRAEGASHFLARSFCNLLARFRDEDKTQLGDLVPDTGLAPEVCAAFQFTFTIPAGGSRVAYISLSSRLPADHVKGAFRNLTPHPGLLTCSSDPCTQNPWHWFYRRTSWMGEMRPWLVWPGYRFGGVDDFDGDADDEAVIHNPTTGEIRIDGLKVVVPLYGSWVLRSTGDFNRDGKADLLFQWVGRPGAGRDWSPLRIWLMNGRELIASVTPADANVVLEPGWLVAGSADFNDDGYIDILFHNQGSNDLMIWRMVGTVMTNITFPYPAIGQGSSWRVVAVGDFGVGSTTAPEATPAIGAPDIVWQDEVTGQLMVWHMNFHEQRTSRRVGWLPTAAVVLGPR